MSTPIADMVTLMLSTGIPPETIALAVKTAELHAQSLYVTDPVAAKRRAYDRERKRTKAEIPPENSNDSLSSSPSPNTKDSKKEEKKERAKRNSGVALPVDWVPKLNHYREAEELGFSRQGVIDQFEDMRIWARSNEHRAVARKSNWDLTFSGWMRRNSKGSGNGGGVGKNGSKVSPITTTVDGIIDQLQSEVDGGEMRENDLRLIENWRRQ